MTWAPPRLDGTPHGLVEYAPSPERYGAALCLSGGGFRAALFHLGALRRFNELGILQQLRTISAASGGSTIAAHLANTWHVWRGQCTTQEWEQKVAAPFRQFVSANLSVRAAIIGWWLTNLGSNAGMDVFAEACDALCPMPLQQLPPSPEFLFCTTDLATAKPVILDRTSERPWRVGKAVAISSCLPPIFRPYIESHPRYLALADGGIADNRGIEPVWRTHETLLVSDGGDVLQPEWNLSMSWAIQRSVSVLDDRMQLAQKRWLLALFMRRVLRGA
jgi:NTE family protein